MYRVALDGLVAIGMGIWVDLTVSVKEPDAEHRELRTDI